MAEAFWSISQEQHFSQIEDLYRNTANNINFHYRINSGKIKNSLISKNPIFCLLWPIFPIFGGKKSFPKKSGTYNLTRFSSTMQKFRET